MSNSESGGDRLLVKGLSAPWLIRYTVGCFYLKLANIIIWTILGTWEAYDYGPGCVQRDWRDVKDWCDVSGDCGPPAVPEQSEDCLFLNIWRPRPVSQNRAVMVCDVQWLCLHAHPLPLQVRIQGEWSVSGAGSERFLQSEFLSLPPTQI